MQHSFLDFVDFLRLQVVELANIITHVEAEVATYSQGNLTIWRMRNLSKLDAEEVVERLDCGCLAGVEMSVCGVAELGTVLNKLKAI